MLNLGIKVDKSKGEEVLSFLRSSNCLHRELRILTQKDHICIPLIREIHDEITEFLNINCIDFSIDQFNFEKLQKLPSVYDLLIDKLSIEMLNLLPKSHDHIGDLIVVDLDEKLLPYSTEIGKAMQLSKKNIRAVWRKSSPVSGVERIRGLELIAGDGNAMTAIHKEHGVRIYVDIKNSYFSPRLSTEHARISTLITENEKIVDMFAGVGSFGLHIAKKHNSEIFSIDINENATACLKKSIKLNNLQGKIHPITADCKEYLQNFTPVDRVLMNLPESAFEFLNLAFDITKPDGVIHFYCFAGGESPEDNAIEILEQNIVSKKYRIQSIKRVRNTSPHEYHMVLDIRKAS